MGAIILLIAAVMVVLNVFRAPEGDVVFMDQSAFISKCSATGGHMPLAQGYGYGCAPPPALCGDLICVCPNGLQVKYSNFIWNGC